MRAILAALAVLLSADSATANWMFNEDEDPFNGNRFTAVTFELSGYGLAFKCTKADDLSVVFVTPERADDKVLAAMQVVPLKLLTIVDTAERVEFETTVDESQAAGTFIFETDADGILAFAKAASIAKKRVAVAVSSDLMEKPIHARTFSTRGLSKALQRLSEKCHLP